MNRFRLMVWLGVLDLLAALGLFGSRPYLWVVERASREEWRSP